MEKRTVISTSLSSAKVSDIKLRESATARLVFRPELIDNPNDAEAAVRGTFLYQPKGPKETWSDTVTIPLSSLKREKAISLNCMPPRFSRFFKSSQTSIGFMRKKAFR